MASVHSLGTWAALLVYPQIPDSEVGCRYHSEKFRYGTVARGWEEFKVGGLRRNHRLLTVPAECLAGLPFPSSHGAHSTPTPPTHGFFPASLRHPHLRVCGFFPIVLRPRMLLAGPLPQSHQRRLFPTAFGGESWVYARDNTEL